MKFFVILFLFVFTGCSTSSNESVKNDFSEEKQTQESFNTVWDSLLEKGINGGKEENEKTELMQIINDDLIDSIRTLINQISDVQSSSWTAINRKDNFSYDGVYEYYSDYDRILKINDSRVNSENPENTSFFFQHHDLVAVVLQYFEIDEGWFHDTLFFHHGTVIKIIEEGDCGAPFSEEHRYSNSLYYKSLLDSALTRYFTVDSIYTVLNTYDSISPTFDYHDRVFVTMLKWMQLNFCNSGNDKLLSRFIQSLEKNTGSVAESPGQALAAMYQCYPDKVLRKISLSKEKSQLLHQLEFGFLNIVPPNYDNTDPLVIKLEHYLGRKLAI